jgi:hypothetical protein
LKRIVIYALLLCGLASFVSCGSSYPSSTSTTTVLPHRALISNLTGSRIDIADTTRDLLVTAIPGDLPGLLVLSSDKKFTISLSPIDASVNVIDNAKQGVAGSTNLSGASQSLVSTVDNGTILAAVPGETAPIGQAPGAVDLITVTTSVSTTGGITTTLTRDPSVFLPGVRFLAASPNTNTFVALSDAVSNPANPVGAPGRVWVIQTSLLNSNLQPYQEVVSPLWDHPIFAVGSADSLFAYVLNCGQECGGTQASIVKVDLSTNQVVGSQLPIPSGATYAFLSGNTLYVAGSDPSVSCGSTGFPAPCGGLTAVDLGVFSAAAPVVIAGGYHDRITLGANNLLFVGSRGCTIVRNTDPLQGTGCLSLFDTAKLSVTLAPPTPFTPPALDPGDDVTGMTPIANRSEVYVIQGGELIIYDTTTAKTKVFDTPPNIIGQGVDVVALDF